MRSELGVMHCAFALNFTGARASVVPGRALDGPNLVAQLRLIRAVSHGRTTQLSGKTPNIGRTGSPTQTALNKSLHLQSEDLLRFGPFRGVTHQTKN